MISQTYLFGVHLPTVTVNIPLNNALQAIEVDVMSDMELLDARENFDNSLEPMEPNQNGFFDFYGYLTHSFALDNIIGL